MNQTDTAQLLAMGQDRRTARELRKSARDAERRAMAPAILARLLGSKAACDEIKAQGKDSGTRDAFPVLAARHAIAFADALIRELDRREERIDD